MAQSVTKAMKLRMNDGKKEVLNEALKAQVVSEREFKLFKNSSTMCGYCTYALCSEPQIINIILRGKALITEDNRDKVVITEYFPQDKLDKQINELIKKSGLTEESLMALDETVLKEKRSENNKRSEERYKKEMVIRNSGLTNEEVLLALDELD